MHVLSYFCCDVCFHGSVSTIQYLLGMICGTGHSCFNQVIGKARGKGKNENKVYFVSCFYQVLPHAQSYLFLFFFKLRRWGRCIVVLVKHQTSHPSTLKLDFFYLLLDGLLVAKVGRISIFTGGTVISWKLIRVLYYGGIFAFSVIVSAWVVPNPCSISNGS